MIDNPYVAPLIYQTYIGKKLLHVPSFGAEQLQTSRISKVAAGMDGSWHVNPRSLRTLNPVRVGYDLCWCEQDDGEAHDSQRCAISNQIEPEERSQCMGQEV